MVSPTLTEYFFGYWIYLKQHPELAGKRFTDFNEFIESEIYAINTCIGLDGGFCEILENAEIFCSVGYRPIIHMLLWNALIDNLTVLELAFVSYFRVKMYEYDEVASGREECKILHTNIEEIARVSKIMHSINDDLFNYQPLTEKEYDEHRYVYSRFTDLLNELSDDCRNNATLRRK